jgi:hypothetical protein
MVRVQLEDCRGSEVQDGGVYEIKGTQVIGMVQEMTRGACFGSGTDDRENEDGVSIQNSSPFQISSLQ